MSEKSISQMIVDNLQQEAMRLEHHGFPLDVFPEKLRSVVLRLRDTNGFRVEYTCAVILTVAAGLIGATHAIKVRTGWNLIPSLYTILVGRPTVGKTPPINALLAPVYQSDSKAIAKYKVEISAYQKAIKEKSDNIGPRPILQQTVVSDITPEKLARVLNDNHRGILICVNEIISLFKMARRYNDSSFNELLLSLFSNSPILVSRVNADIPLYLQKPCASIIGTIQTKVVSEIARLGG
ncbi:MAG: DUF3987 domain-containing protein [Bacteroidales bacterium]|nr:DUF3987 domain-containing protein [Bacteroidales bacterium]